MHGPEIICIGAAHWDVIARADRALPRGADAPGVVSRRPGGVAANVALGLARLGRRVRLISALGRDAAGDDLLVALEDAGVDCAWMLRAPGHPTASYVAIEDASGELVAAVADTAALEAPGLIARLSAPSDWLPPGAALFFETNLPEAALAALPISAAAWTAANAVSPAKAPRLRPFRDRGLGQLYVTRTEAEAILDAGFAAAPDAAAAVRAAFAAPVVVTDGPRQAAFAAPSGAGAAAPNAVAVRSVTGAGDALTAAHLDAILGGAAPEAALRAGLAAAAAHISGDAP